MTTDTVQAAPGTRRPACQRTLHSALLELALTALMMFVVVTTVRWLMGTLDPTAHGWWHTPEGRLLAVAPISGYTVTAVMLSPWGRVTGGHVNPAITLAMWRYGRTPGRDAAPFIAGQLTGSVLGVAAGRLVWGPLISAPAMDYAVIRPAPGWSWAAVAAIEAATMFVIVAVAGIGISSARLGPFTPWAVGTMIATQIITFGTLSGGIANPAREFGPALLSGDLSLLPAYLLAPPVGALTATVAIGRIGTRRPNP
ncbi:MIP/aquaporin family protein [Streptomyces sp. Ag109_G2-15]|uniref:MIP/aquaporin family protein n=1 Tax=Streptomyces sp. Ag109_G2-15 TaxID=1938850 RepID=UPI000BD7DB6A|nr:aquaporin [Streptomyces sp. Ag109_G2-15]SOD89586.1 glycerol uptake facilitator protein/aquaporin Z [Streptomyces sp. Ag109_G2-15]